MKNPIKHGVIALLVSSALLAGRPAEAQKSVPGVMPRQVGPAQENMGPTVSVNFSGGPVREYVQAIKKAAGDKPVNVIVSDEASRVELPPISLRDVTTYTALSALTSAFPGNAEHRFGIDTVGSGADATFAIQYMRETPRSSDPFKQAGGRRLEVYSIRDLIEPPVSASGSPQAKVAYESILSAVEAAMAMFEEANPPKLMYHKETGLLMVGGTQYQTEVVDSLIRRIRDDLQRRWAEERTSKKQSAEQRRRETIVTTEVMLAEQTAAAAAEQLERAQQLQAAGTIPMEALRQAELNLARAQAELQRRRADLDDAKGVEENEGGAKVVVVYDIADLTARDPEVVSTLGVLSERLGASTQVQSGSLVVKGDEKSHEALKQLLSSMRKVAAGGAGGEKRR